MPFANLEVTVALFTPAFPWSRYSRGLWAGFPVGCRGCLGKRGRGPVCVVAPCTHLPAWCSVGRSGWAFRPLLLFPPWKAADPASRSCPRALSWGCQHPIPLPTLPWAVHSLSCHSGFLTLSPCPPWGQLLPWFSKCPVPFSTRVSSPSPEKWLLFLQEAFLDFTGRQTLGCGLSLIPEL